MRYFANNNICAILFFVSINIIASNLDNIKYNNNLINNLRVINKNASTSMLVSYILSKIIYSLR